jgi:hypothetical protein
MPAPIGNRNGAKPAGTQAIALLKLRVTPRDKARFVRAARPGKLSPWVLRTLHAAADQAQIPR